MYISMTSVVTHNARQLFDMGKDRCGTGFTQLQLHNAHCESRIGRSICTIAQYFPLAARGQRNATLLDAQARAAELPSKARMQCTSVLRGTALFHSRSGWLCTSSRR
ncbi:hypothetical protein XAC3729 [Xanthomonas citri pv. citri str. 306]|uniref:Uncharacterized protein n=1 Tax=Xanthomonas axonopodis pv. citri (strain 306) TaxID=190486 RepID=A0AAI8EUA4_XANAC|nr:hypothetical protein XAC3729 [Xanthomonas citri pv. citri str. 306]